MGPLAQLRALAAIHRMSAMRLVTFLVPAFRIRPPMMRLSGQGPSQLARLRRCADSLGLRSFHGIPPTEPTPVHASVGMIRQRLPETVFDEVFRFVL